MTFMRGIALVLDPVISSVVCGKRSLILKSRLMVILPIVIFFQVPLVSASHPIVHSEKALKESPGLGMIGTKSAKTKAEKSIGRIRNLVCVADISDAF